MRKYLLIAFLLAGCTDEESTVRALQGAGYKNIQTGGYAPLMCGREDTYCTSFTAVGLTGIPVEGAVGCGVFKGCTIRTK